MWRSCMTHKAIMEPKARTSRYVIGIRTAGQALIGLNKGIGNTRYNSSTFGSSKHLQQEMLPLHRRLNQNLACTIGKVNIEAQILMNFWLIVVILAVST